MEDIVIGIDLGTTNCRVAIWRNKKVEIIKDKYGNKNIPSIVAFNKNGRLTGFDAKKQMENNPFNTIYDVKRFIGKNYNDNTVQTDIQHLTYKIVETNNNNIGIVSKYVDKIMTPEEIISFILIKVKNIAESYIKQYIQPDFSISKVVITIPAYFNDSQRQATLDAAKIAGLNVIRMINEPTAAALAYGINNMDGNDKNIIVYDLGGGTLDISLLSIESDGLFKVIATSGNTHLGGEDFNEYLYNYVLDQFMKNDMLNNKIKKKYYYKNLQKLRLECEKAKIKLSNEYHTKIFIESFYTDNDNNIVLDLDINITREQYETICKDIFDACIEPIHDILQYSKFNINQINEIILVGGPTRTPKLQELIYNIFHKKPVIDIDPDTVVATGAAIQGYIINNKDDPFCDDIALLDITALTLGIETEGGIMVPVIDKNTTIPVSRSRKFSTSEDNMESVEIKIYEGERKLVKDNHLVGKFTLNNIQKAPKGVPAIIVKIHVDVNGIISVSAVDKKMGSENSIQITGSNSRLSKDEINLLIKNAQSYETEDTYKYKLIELFNEYRKIIDMVEYNVFKNNESNISENDKNKILNDINEYNNYFTNLLITNDYYNFELDFNSSTYIKKFPYKLTINNKTNDNDEIFNKQKYSLLQYIINQYKIKLKLMNKKYANLIIQLNNVDDQTIKAITNSNSFVDINDDINNDINIDDQFIINNNIDINEDDPTIITEKADLLNLINSINEYLENNNIDQTKKDNAREYLRNTDIWMKINKTIDKNNYLEKYNEVNIIIGNILLT